MAHKAQLHYINAVISESMRKSSVVSSGVPHFIDEDTWVGHYFFPKGANVMANLTFIHYNPGHSNAQTETLFFSNVRSGRPREEVVL